MNDYKIGNQVIKVKSVDSTNNYAAKLLNQTKVPFGSVIMAHYQTSGRGQRNSVWNSINGDNLLISVILDLSSIPPAKIFYLSKLVALAIKSSVENITGIEVQLKWPNDILVNNKKVAGVLIENQWKDKKIASSVVGIGLNVNQIDFSGINSATSLKTISGKNYELNVVLKLLCDKLNIYFEMLINLDYQTIDEEYHKSLKNINNWCDFIQNNNLFKAFVKGVNEQGELVLEFRNGIIKTYELKQITQLR